MLFEFRFGDASKRNKIAFKLLTELSGFQHVEVPAPRKSPKMSLQPPSTKPPPSQHEILTRALSYPYPRPEHSFVFPHANTSLTPAEEATHLANKGLNAVLAIGSNASPYQLNRKFGTTEEIPVLAVHISNVEVVYTALISNYGSVPATVIHSPGTEIAAHMTLLTDAQFEHMNETESGYALVQMNSGLVRLRSGMGVDAGREVLGYVSCQATLRGMDGLPLAIENFVGSGRVLMAGGQVDAQMACRLGSVRKGVLKDGEPVEEFILRNVRDEDRRKRISRTLGGEVSAPIDDEVWQFLKVL